MPPDRGQAAVVEPAAHLRGVVAVQLPELDALVPEAGDGPECPFEVALALAAERVQHQPDAGRGLGSVCQGVVTAPSLADSTCAAYFAITPVS